jgi:hypothetical protein
MKTIYDPSTLNEILTRINSLTPATQRKWGKMDIAQMLAHCNETLKVVTNRSTPKRVLIGFILGPLFKKDYLGEKPLRRNSPTHPTFVMVNERVFAEEQAMYIAMVTEFSRGGEAKCTSHPHSFFGTFTPQEWGTSTYKHLDHHLQQFGV